MRQPLADAGMGWSIVGLVGRVVGLPGRLGNHDQRRGAAGMAQAGNALNDIGEPPAHFGQEHDVGASGDAGGDGDMAGVAAHHLQHHDAVVAGAGRLQAVERFGGDGHRRRIADGALGAADVIIDGFRHADEGQARRRQQPAQDVEAAVAADADQPVEMQLTQALVHLGRAVLQRAVGHRVGERIAAIGAAEERAALARQRRIEPGRIERLGGDRTAQQTECAVADADRLPAVTMVGAQGHGPDGGVEAGAIAAAGQDTDGLGHEPPPCLV